MNWLLRCVVLIGVFAAGAVTTLGVQRVLPPQNTDADTIVVYRDWRLICPSIERGKPCEVDQDLVDGRSHQVIAHLSIEKDLTITVPHNLLLPPGVAVAVGSNDPKVYPYQACTIVGCVVPVPMDEALEHALRGSDSGRLIVVNAAGRPVALPFSLRGADQALDALAHETARRGSWWTRLWS